MFESSSSFEPNLVHEKDLVSPEQEEALYSRDDYKAHVDGVTVIFGRPEVELENKWKENKIYFGARTLSTKDGNKKRVASFIQNRSYIDMDVTSTGDINNINDGNTRLYVSMKLGIDPKEVPVRYILPTGEKVEGNFADAIQAAKQIK